MNLPGDLRGPQTCGSRGWTQGTPYLIILKATWIMIQPYSDHTKLIQAAGANQRMSAARWSRSNSLVSAFQIFQRPKRPVDLDLSLRKARFHIFHLRAAMVSEGAEVCVAAYDYATSTTLQFGEVYSPMLNPSVDICYKSLWCSQPWW
jgi:hypothetical protein